MVRPRAELRCATARTLAQADDATRTYAARFTIEQVDDAVAFGMTATVTLTQAADARVARVPLSARLASRETRKSANIEPSSGVIWGMSSKVISRQLGTFRCNIIALAAE
jgi:hypothetical protein